MPVSGGQLLQIQEIGSSVSGLVIIPCQHQGSIVLAELSKQSLPFQFAVLAEPVEPVEIAAAAVVVAATLFSVAEHCSRPASKR